MYSRMTIVNNSNLKVAKRIDLKCSHHTHTHKVLYKGIES